MYGHTRLAGEALGMAALPSLGLAAKKRIGLPDTGKLAEAGQGMLKAENADEATEILSSVLPEGYLGLIS